MSLNVLGTSNTKPYISANVNSITANTLIVRVNSTEEGNISYQEYTPSVLTSDFGFLQFNDSKFLYKQVSSGAEMQLHIVFSINGLMVGLGGSQRGIIFSLPQGITTVETVGQVANGYMAPETPVVLTGFKTNIIKEVTMPSTDQVRILFANPNFSGYNNINYYFRGEVILRIRLS